MRRRSFVTQMGDIDKNDARAAEGIEESLRFAFGRNWSKFIDRHFTEARVADSMRHLLDVLRIPSLEGLAFLDIGCGSGLHSLAALRAGARHVYAFDYDPDAVATCRTVRDFAAYAADRWQIAQGSVLDAEAMRRLRPADVVYAWGALHHTGDLWSALDNALIPLKPGGVLYVALYSSDIYVPRVAERWVRIKRAYNRAHPLRKRFMEFDYLARTFLNLARKGISPWRYLREYQPRGMDFQTDMRDWLGGWPIQFASYREVDSWSVRRGYRIVNAMVGEGCTEYVIADPAVNTQWGDEQRRRQQSLRPLSRPYVRRDGCAWTATLPDLASEADDSLPPRGSRLMLYDREHPFGLPHFSPKLVARDGQGRFCHWEEQVVFSTPDGSDPNAEPARWRYCASY